jgi:hypothetical protein
MNKETLFQAAAEELAIELVTMHGTLFNLIVTLRNTELSKGQSFLLSAAEVELKASQKRFFARYGDMLGGAAPERN